MLKLSSREKKIFFITVSIVVVAVLFNVVSAMNPENSSDNGNNLERYKRLYKKYSYQQSLAKDYAPLIKKYKDVLGAKLSLEDASAALFQTVKGIVQKEGTVIERIKPKHVKSKDNHKEIAFEIELVGTFVQVFKTINSLETNKALINVNSLKITPISKESNTIRTVMTISRPFFEYIQDQ